MIHFDLPKEKSSILKVIGVGGGGGNAVNYMFCQHIEGVNFVICNTDAQALASSGIPNRIQLGPHLTQGLGAGANPDIGRQATEESLEEIKRILEVNTKMAFITAGMGGGTGTGGAPIIAKICKDLGILTVGIVTTPFAYEGKKRQQQAQEGIKNLEQYVDTLLVISNDKLRHQFGNLKMREAFEKADNVLATAAKCITDVINSTGQINVDFADVCTVMKNGGVAILGNATAEGENRALKAIEEALSSPLLNDSNIQGAKWILININSATGEHEFTMDEVEVIQNYLLTQAGDNTDVILGMGYDNTLGNKISITLIATGFEHKDPFAKPITKKEELKKEEKIVMVLGQVGEEISASSKNEKTLKEVEPETTSIASGENLEYLMPKLVEAVPVMQAPIIDITDIKDDEPVVVHFELQATEPENRNNRIEKAGIDTVENLSTVGKISIAEKNEKINSVPQQASVPAINKEKESELALSIKDSTSSTSPVSAASGGYLTRPSNIYAESKPEVVTSKTSTEEPVPSDLAASKEQEDLLGLQMQLVERDDIQAADMPLAYQAQAPLFPEVEDPALWDETEEQKRKTAERLRKLRNLSFNVNAADPNNEFETVPAYIRRNMELHTGQAGNAQVENFYSNYEVKIDDKNQPHISEFNKFLEGKKPD
jgi:cell division protein FtsZ